MKRLSGQFIVLAIYLSLLSGCASRGDFTAITGKNVNLASIKVDRKMAKGRTMGEDCQNTVFIFPIGHPATLDEALDRALEPKQANLLLDAVVRWQNFGVPLIFGQECWKAEGVAYDTFK